MTNTKSLFMLLPLLAMACTLTAESAVMSATSLPEQTVIASPTQTLPPTPLICQVKTGIESGGLNLRVCGGTACPVLIVLHEGETLTQTEQKPVNDWIQVITADGLQGWVNSTYLDCEVTK
jgi:uncharacterized protein YgiM (DUF1202 family)